MRNAGGYASITSNDSGKVTREHDTFTCKHCNKIVRVPPGEVSQTVGAFCRVCMGHICDEDDVRQMRDPVSGKRIFDHQGRPVMAPCPGGCTGEMERHVKCVTLEERICEMERDGANRRRGGRMR